MFYYLYEIRNNLNNKIYVGVHKAKKMDDGYMGSGKIIRSAIQKYGIANFSKVVLETFENAEAMYAREKEIVTDEFLLREDVYNLRRGGDGGFDYINKNGIGVLLSEQRRRNPELIEKASALGNAEKRNKAKSDPVYAEYLRQIRLNGLQKARENNPNGTFFGKVHSEETKLIMSNIAKERLKDPTKNSQFGTMWITNESESIKVKKTDSIPAGWRKGRVMINENQ